MGRIIVKSGLEPVKEYCENIINFSNDVFWEPFGIKMYLPSIYIIDHFLIEPRDIYSETFAVFCSEPERAHHHIHTVTHFSNKITDNLESNFSKYRSMLEFEHTASALLIGERDASPRFSQCILGYVSRLTWAAMNPSDSKIFSLPDIVMHSLFKCSDDEGEMLRSIGYYLFNKKLGAERARNNLAKSLNIEEKTMSKLEKAMRLKDIIKMATTKIKDFDKNFYKYSVKPSKPNDAASLAQFFLIENVGASFCAKRPICSYFDLNEYLFKLKTEYREYLKIGKVDEQLENAFKDNKISLSNSANISKIDEKNWKITDGTVFYRIEDIGGRLNIYHDSEQIWRFPVHLTDPKIGNLGYVGEIIVENETNKIINHTPIDGMRKKAMELDKKFKDG